MSGVNIPLFFEILHIYHEYYLFQNRINFLTLRYIACKMILITYNLNNYECQYSDYFSIVLKHIFKDNDDIK